jgi:cytochrome b subunit of formate dehydrogenase
MSGTDSRAMVERMSLWQRIEHGLLMLFVVMLVASGLALVYHTHGWAKLLVRCMGGLEGRLMVHRVGAVGLMALGVVHFLTLAFIPRCRRDFRESWPTGEDFGHIWSRFKYRMTGRGEAPRFGHFTPMQKFQYWGIFLGCVIMAVSGLVLWFKTQALVILPKAVFDLMLVVHSSQAQLIFLLFILWHLYDVHLAAGNFPMNPAWLTGRMPEEAFKQQHAAEWEAIRKDGEA